MLEIQVRFSRLSLNHYTEVVQRLPNLQVKINAHFQDDTEENWFHVQKVSSLLYQGAQSALPQEGSFDLVYRPLSRFFCADWLALQLVTLCCPSAFSLFSP